ncbi:heavy metal translocating P-type ATPase [Azomonas macrocytogenes]|uniref:P-type Zn(2+) transporter n=1 Tax=Azomonas macrocytogenes TaxID=69962 RepID=A0A839T5U2_AZOMA|nr:heavy metal translocating P-type ATPase [Azomonas macrocytogenes]MBB3104871.1 Cd2+/Zn2+-exporting ATPase [Azomonas macrocytogenes]
MSTCCDQQSELPILDTCCNTAGDHAHLQSETPLQHQEYSSFFRIEQMDCPNEEALIRDKLTKLPQVRDLEFNLVQRTLRIWHDALPTGQIAAAIAALGMQAESLSVQTETSIRIEQMCCPVEERLITGKLSGMPGITELRFNLLQRTLVLGHESHSLEPALRAIRGLGFTPQIIGRTGAKTTAPSAPARKDTWKLIVAGLAAIAAEALHFLQSGPEWLIVAFALAAILASGLDVYRKGWIALKNRNLNINALMSVAVTGAILIGQWPEAAMVMFLFAIAERIEARSLDRARDAIRGLIDLAPQQATVRKEDGSWQELDAAEIVLDSVVRVRPGERIALDGVVLEGHSSVDQAPITGESLPVEKTIGDPLFAGTINQAGALEYRVTAMADDTTLARIIHAVEKAQGSRAPTQRFIDKFSHIYTPVVFALSLAVAVLPPLFFEVSWHEWIYRALVLLVVACPCALVISTPVSIVSGLASAARKGILIKGGVHLENGRHITHLALDKTGTLTHGKPMQTDFVTLGPDTPERYHALAASLARRSDHPVSRALASTATAGLPQHEVAHFAALPGRGVRGVIDSQTYHLGNHRLLEELNLCSPEIEHRLDELERQGKSVILLCDETRALALFAVADTLKDNSRSAVKELHRLGVKTLILSGDNLYTAQAIATQVGIDEIRANLLPDDKLQAVAALLGKHRTVGMVGDGINDAPALAHADIGFAMGAIGSDTAIETADVAIMDDDLGKIPAFIRLSRQTATVLKQNIGLALGIKAVFLTVALTGHATLWMAVFADVGVSLLVVANGLRLLRA